MVACALQALLGHARDQPRHCRTPLRCTPPAWHRASLVRRRTGSAVACCASTLQLDELDEALPWSPSFAAAFLEKYWQKRPCILRRSLSADGLHEILDADALAGITCSDEAPSRLIMGGCDKVPWSLRRGPFDEATFASLPESGHWTLVVNGVDRAVPAIADALLPLFSFLPLWRVDDIQVSYAPGCGSSVGPHFDSFDVFLAQVGGAKQWGLSMDERYSTRNEDAFLPGLDLAVLADWQPQLSVVLQPGDVLYLPPGVAHHGVALEEGFTYSVGFLAPTRREMYVSYAAAAASATAASLRWTDPWLSPAARPGELSGEAIDAALAVVDSLPRTREAVAAWFGALVTEPRGDAQPPSQLGERPTWGWVCEQAAQAGEVQRHEASRMVYLPNSTLGKVDSPGGTLFCDGQRFAAATPACARVMAELADGRCVSWEKLKSLGVPGEEPQGEEEEECASALLSLLEVGLIFIPSDELEEGEETEMDDERVEVFDL